MSDKPRLAFPDWPMTAAEVRASLRGDEPAVKNAKWEITELVTTTNMVIVEATDEDEAWLKWNRDEVLSRRFVDEELSDETHVIRRLS